MGKCAHKHFDIRPRHSVPNESEVGSSNIEAPRLEIQEKINAAAAAVFLANAGKRNNVPLAITKLASLAESP